jgi:hypothetical protein
MDAMMILMRMVAQRHYPLKGEVADHTETAAAASDPCWQRDYSISNVAVIELSIFS